MSYTEDELTGLQFGDEQRDMKITVVYTLFCSFEVGL